MKYKISKVTFEKTLIKEVTDFITLADCERLKLAHHEYDFDYQIYNFILEICWGAICWSK